MKKLVVALAFMLLVGCSPLHVGSPISEYVVKLSCNYNDMEILKSVNSILAEFETWSDVESIDDYGDGVKIITIHSTVDKNKILEELRSALWVDTAFIR